MDRLYELEIKKANYERDISVAEAGISKISREYDSLIAFRPKAERLESSFQSMLKEAKRRARSFDGTVTEECRTARIYQERMSSYLDGSGAKVVGVAISAYLTLIAERLKLLRTQVEQKEDLIRRTKRQLADVEAEIRKIKADA